LRYVRNPPSSTEGIYTEDYFFGGNAHGGYVDYDREKEVMRGTLQRYLEVIEAYVPPGRFLDVGAATGYFLGLARERGWTVSGVEMSAAAAHHGTQKGISMHVGTLETSPFGAGSFDAISMIDVLEHTSDPHSLLKKAHEVLRSGGILLINTPDAGSLFARLMGKRWHLICPPEHLVYFNRKNLAHLLCLEGYEVLSVGSIGKRFTLQYIMNTAARWLSSSILRSLARRIEKTRIGACAIPLNLGDNMLLVAKKH